ncbi:hypothetical protein DL764_006665 [Monosporascus ibericus]|uniref:Uncharacterized protein n=1 Tax=Monosporascus ibericus TaxID=155417 RepID=A0A4Q4T465_9PEZI|nr:hypothetical protein DL764_006665 [Monosporascus ibericus]
MNRYNLIAAAPSGTSKPSGEMDNSPPAEWFFTPSAMVLQLQDESVCEISSNYVECKDKTKFMIPPIATTFLSPYPPLAMLPRQTWEA